MSAEVVHLWDARYLFYQVLGRWVVLNIHWMIFLLLLPLMAWCLELFLDWERGLVDWLIG